MSWLHFSAAVFFCATPLADLLGWDVVGPMVFGLAGLKLAVWSAILIIEMERDLLESDQ